MAPGAAPQPGSPARRPVGEAYFRASAPRMRVRPGLVVVGVALIFLGAASVVTFSLSQTTSDNDQRSTLLPNVVGANNTGSALLTGTDAESATFTVTWSSTVPLQVTLLSVPGCIPFQPPCPGTSTVATWAQNLSGTYSVSGPIRFPFLLVWTDSTPGTGFLNATALEAVHTTVGPSWSDQLVVDAAGVVLAGIGAVSLFLGLFLRGGDLTGPAPIVSRSADDLEPAAPKVPPGSR